MGTVIRTSEKAAVLCSFGVVVSPFLQCLLREAYVLIEDDALVRRYGWQKGRPGCKLDTARPCIGRLPSVPRTLSSVLSIREGRVY